MGKHNSCFFVCLFFTLFIDRDTLTGGSVMEMAALNPLIDTDRH